MKFRQQFEITKMFVANFLTISQVIPALGPENRPEKFGVKTGLIWKCFKYGKGVSRG